MSRTNHNVSYHDMLPVSVTLPNVWEERTAAMMPELPDSDALAPDCRV